jgi:DNA-binding response OmpR family regulator
MTSSSGLRWAWDDYVVKPFSPKELMARVNVIVKRHPAAADCGKREEGEGVLNFSGLRIDTLGHGVTVDGRKAELTPKEYELLNYFAQNRGIALTRELILGAVWGYDFYGDDRTVDAQVKLLRNNLGPYRDYIVTLRGVGYKIEV